MVDITDESLSAYGQLFGIVQLLQIALIGYHLFTVQAGGPPVYINLVAGLVLAVLFFMQSKNSGSEEE